MVFSPSPLSLTQRKMCGQESKAMKADLARINQQLKELYEKTHSVGGGLVILPFFFNFVILLEEVWLYYFFFFLILLLYKCLCFIIFYFSFPFKKIRLLMMTPR
jgi:hypothetical protein